MKAETPKKIYLKDYQKPEFACLSMELSFDIHEEKTVVTQKSHWKTIFPITHMFLDGEELQLASIKLNGETPAYKVHEHGLELTSIPQEFHLEIVTELKPQDNTALEGLYMTGQPGQQRHLVTQCEPESFRRITYFLDRPDVMTTYKVTIEADQKKYPVLLSNGNLVEKTSMDAGRHRVVWTDPFKKPCYLFCLVAGDFGKIEDTYTTLTGKKVRLEIYAPHGKQARCHHAMESLKKCMRWDEERFGREYDLDIYMIVSIDDFNAGAMENKGLNVFNSKYILADEKTATDLDYFNIESVVAHEYFHNWTGNRVTLRDWFHISLKEGLTVFRDQEFSMDQAGRDALSQNLVRIDNVSALRSAQFAEDAGPNAHPIRPDSCYAVNNFFTMTIYEKGSEVIRMMQTMVGRPGFRKGMDLYFDRHDGQAVIIEDFASAIAEPNKQDWSQFKRWYSQAGTPWVAVKEDYNSQTQTYEIKLTQSCALTQQESQENREKLPFHIPLVVGLLDATTGKEITIDSSDAVKNTEGNYVLHLKEQSQKFVFKNCKQKPVLSINRVFSAPIHLKWPHSDAEMLVVLQHDTDAFNRFEASQKLMMQALKAAIVKNDFSLINNLTLALHNVLKDEKVPAGLKARMLSIPDMSQIVQELEKFHPETVQTAVKKLKEQIFAVAEKDLLQTYQTHFGKYDQSKQSEDFQKRKLQNLCLSYLVAGSSKYNPLALTQYEKSPLMNDQVEALKALSYNNSSECEKALRDFYSKWKDDALVLTKWFQIQALSQDGQTFEKVKELSQDPKFEIKNPNNVYSLFVAFGKNLTQFHSAQNKAHSWLAEKVVEIDQLNPQVASRVVTVFDIWAKLEGESKTSVLAAIDLLKKANLSKNTYEIVSKLGETH